MRRVLMRRVLMRRVLKEKSVWKSVEVLSVNEKSVKGMNGKRIPNADAEDASKIMSIPNPNPTCANANGYNKSNKTIKIIKIIIKILFNNS
jgi:hypothetical protein